MIGNTTGGADEGRRVGGRSTLVGPARFFCVLVPSLVGCLLDPMKIGPDDSGSERGDDSVVDGGTEADGETGGGDGDGDGDGEGDGGGDGGGGGDGADAG